MNIAKTLVFLGLLLTAMGGLLWIAPKVPGLEKLGKLPGDIRVEGKSFSFYFPLVTCVVLSLLFTVILYVIGRLK